MVREGASVPPPNMGRPTPEEAEKAKQTRAAIDSAAARKTAREAKQTRGNGHRKRG